MRIAAHISTLNWAEKWMIMMTIFIVILLAEICVLYAMQHKKIICKAATTSWNRNEFTSTEVAICRFVTLRLGAYKSPRDAYKRSNKIVAKPNDDHQFPNRRPESIDLCVIWSPQSTRTEQCDRETYTQSHGNAIKINGTLRLTESEWRNERLFKQDRTTEMEATWQCSHNVNMA